MRNALMRVRRIGTEEIEMHLYGNFAGLEHAGA